MSTKPKALYLTTLELSELDEACRIFHDAFGDWPYLVGSVNDKPTYRDVDVRLILDDEQFEALFGGNRKALWGLISRLGAAYLRQRTGLPVDFQIQRQSVANEKHGSKRRNPLGLRTELDLYAGGGDAT